jgi:hypothetical protein
MSVTKNEIEIAYQLLLGREPENTFMVKEYIDGLTDISQLVEQIKISKEFNGDFCKQQLSDITANKELVTLAIQFFLARPPVESDFTNFLDGVNNQYQLINIIFNCDEYRRDNYKRVYKSGAELEALSKSVKFSDKPRLVYLHIPKTAGKSLQRVLEKNYGHNVSLTTSGVANEHQWLNSTVIGGHITYPFYHSSPRTRLFVALVRDPVERALSRFNYYRSIQGPSYNKRESRGFDHSDLKKTIQNSVFREEFVDNYQCRFLSGKSTFRGLRYTLKKDNFVIGTMEHVDQLIKHIGSRCSWNSLDIPVINQATNTHYLDDLKQDKALIDMIKRLNREDYKLYEFIRNLGVYSSCSSDFDYRPYSTRICN